MGRKNMVRGLLPLAILSVLFAASGCGGTQMAAVNGTVKYEGKPLAEGEISFFGVGEGKPPEVLTISNGAFSGTVSTGKKKIEIRAYREGKPLPKDTPGADSSTPPKENFIPAQYNSASTLNEEIKAAGPNTFTFDLKKS